MNIKDDDESFEVNDPANCSEEAKLICQKWKERAWVFAFNQNYYRITGLLILIWSAPADWLGWLTFFLAGICETIKLQDRKIGWIPLSFQWKIGYFPELNNIFFVFHDTICSGWRLGTWSRPVSWYDYSKNLILGGIKIGAWSWFGTGHEVQNCF